MAVKNIDSRGYFMTDEGAFYRKGLNDATHLMKIFGNTPGFNKELYEKYKENIKIIGAITRTGERFEISREDFDKYKMERTFIKDEPQYFVGRNRWSVTNKIKE